MSQFSTLFAFTLIGICTIGLLGRKEWDESCEVITKVVSHIVLFSYC